MVHIGAQLASKRKTTSKRFFLTKGQIVIDCFVLVLCALISSLFVHNVNKNRKETQLAEAAIYGQNVAAGMLLVLDQSINATQVLKNLYMDYGKDLENDFSSICAHFYNDNPEIGSIYIAPKGVIKIAYPEIVAEKTLGFDMLNDPDQGPRAQMAIDTGRVTIAGPLKLIEGNTGLIIRNPCFQNGKFTFFSIVVLDWYSYVRQVFRVINIKDSGYHIAVWKKNNQNVITDTYGFILNDSGKDISRIIDIEIRVPNDAWHLSVEPINGWASLSDIIPIIIACIFVVLGLLCFIMYNQIQDNRKIYEYEHDILTGLYTRSAFYRRVRKLFKENPDVEYDIMVSDIENFKLLNAVYGTKKCDELLQYLASEYQKILPDPIFARYGGDLFVNIFRNSMRSSADAFEKKVLEIAANAPIPNPVIKYGYYGKVDKSLPPNLLCDRALIAAKSILRNYDNTIANYEGEISHRHMKEHVLEASFLDAIENKDFKVWYQPKFDAKTEKVIGAEALVRWISNGNIISPADFIYVFENDGLIVRLDEYVFRTVCSTIKTMLDEGARVLPISINLSRASLNHTGITEKYKNIIDEIGIPIDLISLEITETTAIQNNQIKNLAVELKEAGFRIDMDDFGSGSSSLASLNIIPFDVIKLDKSLIDFIGTPDGNELLRHSIELAHFKNIHVVAEGVEKKEQLDFLRSLKCDTIQGYYYSAPLPYEKCIEYMRKMDKE